MKFDKDIPGIYWSFDYEHAVSPDVQKAQMQANMEQLAKYRAKRIGEYKEWSKPENILSRLLKHNAAAEAALERGKLLSTIAKAQQLPPLPKAYQRPSRWQRMKWAWKRLKIRMRSKWTTFLRR